MMTSLGKNGRRILMSALTALGLCASGLALAGPKTLVTLEGGKPKAGLAKAWKKVKDGQYEFTLDTNLEVKPGTKVTPALVKDSLEAKLGASHKVTVAPKGADKVLVSFGGDEAGFLDQVSKAKIRGGKDVEVAMDSSVSDGGIRAKTTDRPPADGEVKALVIKVEAGVITVRINSSKSPNLKDGQKIKVKGEVKGAKPNDTVFFKPEKEEGGVWVPVAGSLQ